MREVYKHRGWTGNMLTGYTGKRMLKTTVQYTGSWRHCCFFDFDEPAQERKDNFQTVLPEVHRTAP